MSQDLLTQLAEYGAYCEERQRSVAPDEVIGGVIPIPVPVRSTRPRRGWLVAVAAAAVVLVLVGGLALLSRVSGPDSPVATTPTDPSSPSAWSRVPDDEAVFGGEGDVEMKSVTVGGLGLVAVGWAGSSGDDDAAVWTSPDGVAWSRIPHDEAVFGGADDQGMQSVTVGGPGLVAAGWDGSSGDGGDGDAAVWTSPDGVAWSRVPHDEAVFGGGWIGSVVIGGPGLVAVGWDSSRGLDAAVWTSPDGVTWSRVPHDEAVFGGAVPHDEAVLGGAGMMSVAVGGPGLVGVGFADSEAAVWTSPDGITWSQVPHDEAVFGGGGQGQFMGGVTVGGPGLVAVGWDASRGQDAAVWTSPNGITWSRIPDDEMVFGGAGTYHMHGVIAAGSGLVAVGDGGDYAPGESGVNAAVWEWGD